MIITNEAHYSIAKKLELEQNKLRYEIYTNKRKINGLVEQQTLKKRELGELQKLIKQLRT